jgi:hypothetical protein
VLRRGRGGSETLTPGRGELQNPSPHLARTNSLLAKRSKTLFCGGSRNKCPFSRDPFTSARIFRWLRERSSGFAWQRRETFTITGKARVSGVRQDHVLCANVRPRQTATAAVSSGRTRAPWTLGTNKKLSVLEHLPYALLNLQLARKNSASVIPNGVCGVRNPSFLGYLAWRSFF